MDRQRSTREPDTKLLARGVTFLRTPTLTVSKTRHDHYFHCAPSCRNNNAGVQLHAWQNLPPGDVHQPTPHAQKQRTHELTCRSP